MPAIADSQQLLNTVVTGVTATCQHVMRSTEPQEQLNAAGGCVGWSIPDHWTTDDWSLTQAIGAHGSLPAVLVRESMAVLAYSQLRPIEAPAQILLSLGFGSIRASICTAQSGKWQCINSPRKTPQAGYLLREELARHWDDQVIVREVKKNARDQLEQNQLLRNAIDIAIVNLATQESTEVKAKIFDKELMLGISRDQCTKLLEKHLRSRLCELIEELLQSPSIPSARIPIAVWGELTPILPLNEWLDQFQPRGNSVEMLPLEVVASGTARLASVINENNDLFSGCLAYSSTTNGAYDENKKVGSIPVIHSLPIALVNSVTSVEARLISLAADDSESEKRPLKNKRLVLGRATDVDWVWQDETGVVSGYHALVLREGHGYIVRDLNSTNGTFVNDKQLKDDKVLKNGDIIALGQTGPKFKFEE